MNQFRVVYTAKSEREPEQNQLHDVKFATKNEAIEFALKKDVNPGLSYIQHFAEDGTPLETILPDDLKKSTKGGRSGKS